MASAVLPARLHERTADDVSIVTGTDTSILQLSYHPPFDWLGALAFLKARELKGVEWGTKNFYSRTVHLGEHKGWDQNNTCRMQECRHAGVYP